MNIEVILKSCHSFRYADCENITDFLIFPSVHNTDSAYFVAEVAAFLFFESVRAQS
jgi:hypothetical protein